MKNKSIITVIVIILLLVLIGVVCFGYYKKATFKVENPIATMEVENFGTIKIELYPDMAPETVANFIQLANNEYYDGLTFHRIVKDFMIQGGDSAGDGTGSVTIGDLEKTDDDTPYSIKGEFIANGFNKNTLKHEEGVISMARADYTSYSSSLTEESYNSAGAQFFIMTAENTSLNGYYAAFGKVIEGMEVVHAIEGVEVEAAEEGAEASTPKEAPVITSIRVETYGVDYKLKEKLEPFDYTTWLYNQYGISQDAITTETDTEETDEEEETSAEEETTDTEE